MREQIRLTAMLGAAVIAGCTTSAAAAQQFELSQFPPNHDTALVIDLQHEDSIAAAFFARHPPREKLSFVELRLRAKDVRPAADHFAFAKSNADSIWLAYAIQPGSTNSLSIADIDVLPTWRDVNPVPLFGEISTDPGLTIYRQGLLRVVALNSESSAASNFDVEGIGPVQLERPDLVAFTLPKGYQGRTFERSGSMFEPSPLKVTPMVVFSRVGTTDDKIRMKYMVPEPDWTGELVPRLEKMVPILFGVVLLLFTQAAKINMKRYVPVASAIGLAIAGIYGFFIYRAWNSGSGFSGIIIDLGLLLVYAIVAWLGFYLTRKRASAEPPADAGPPAVV